MSDVKCIGLDVHKTSISAAVLDESGKLVMQAVFMTKAAAILGFLGGLSGSLRVTFDQEIRWRSGEIARKPGTSARELLASRSSRAL